jgi:catechol 2,3-dioxygenase-like lactoylglutathione lyase family enzyme
MTVELNHIIVPARDKAASARFLADILGLTPGAPFGPFVPVTVGNAVTLDFADYTEYHPQHCAFLVDDEVFDAAFARIRDRGITYYADPGHTRPGELNHHNGGRGFYFDDPGGHNMELLTRAS